MYKEYGNEHAIAFYNPSLRIDPIYIKTNANNPEYTLVVLKPEYYVNADFFIYGNNRLAKLVVPPDSDAVICFNETKEDGGSRQHQYVFRKEGDRWIFCR